MRPLGVTLVGFYQILRGLLSLLFGLSLMLFSGLAAKLASMAAEGNAVERFMHSAGHAAGLSVVVFGVVHILAGYGVLQMQNWGRLLTLFFSAVGLVMVLPWLIHAHLPSLFFGAINAACILYLAMPPIKRAFHAERGAMRMAA